jgi:hypothetical protein
MIVYPALRGDLKNQLCGNHRDLKNFPILRITSPSLHPEKNEPEKSCCRFRQRKMTAKIALLIGRK